MLALRKLKTGEERLELCDVPEPTLKPGHVIIDVAATGICGTDLHILKDEFRANPPVTLGHEVGGRVAALGEGVEGWEVGQRVVSETYFSTCGRCRQCRNGRPNLCAERASIGSMVDGAFAEKLLVPAINLHALPDTLAFPEAALIEPLACVVRGLIELNRVQAGDRALITGPGPIGLLALQVAKASGATVVMVGTSADRGRLELARTLGADALVELSGDTEADKEKILADLGAPADVVIECSGAAPAASLLLDLVAKAGRYIQVGLYGKPIPLEMDQVCAKELTVTGSFATVPSSWERALDMAASGEVSLKGIVGASYPLRDWQAAFDAVMNRIAGKVLLLP